MSNMATLENAFWIGKCARSINGPSWMEGSLQRVAGKEPEKEQKGTYNALNVSSAQKRDGLPVATPRVTEPPY